MRMGSPARPFSDHVPFAQRTLQRPAVRTPTLSESHSVAWATSRNTEMPVAVSVVIPAYNAAATIGEAIESALAQDFRDREIIVVNDGSTDSTGEVLRRYGDRIRVIEQANRGETGA